ncbi:hypothetical protein G2W53_025756 [Senna tora]|uniref:Uncharacterized protein n=1 Tax=Senna tora TaxID=362788 RepID=A0A834TFH0_9FABA|nr:hypothetical protein G2W53_025756 [Senna tora]
MKPHPIRHIAQNHTPLPIIIININPQILTQNLAKFAHLRTKHKLIITTSTSSITEFLNLEPIAHRFAARPAFHSARRHEPLARGTIESAEPPHRGFDANGRSRESDVQIGGDSNRALFGIRGFEGEASPVTSEGDVEKKAKRRRTRGALTISPAEEEKFMDLSLQNATFSVEIKRIPAIGPAVVYK